jgi:hypothetical protein
MQEVKNREADRQRIAKQTADFLAAGGDIFEATSSFNHSRCRVCQAEVPPARFNKTTQVRTVCSTKCAKLYIQKL